MTEPYPYEAPVSAQLFDRARAVTPGGVNSPVRAFRAVGGTPRFMVEGSGPWITDADGRRYVDLVSSWGPMILGHAHPAVVEAVTAYQVSGEYAMVEAAAANGWIDRERAVLETLTAIRRAGAGSVLTYWAVEAARWLR